MSPGDLVKWNGRRVKLVAIRGDMAAITTLFGKARLVQLEELTPSKSVKMKLNADGQEETVA